MILKKCHFCPKTAIVSKICKDQDRGQGAKIFCWSKRLVTILMILILAFKYFMMVFSPKIHPDPPNISQQLSHCWSQHSQASSTTLVFKILMDELWMNSVALLGEYGVGKTVLLQAALRNMKKKGIKVKSIYKQFGCILYVYDLKVILISALDNGYAGDGVLEISFRYLLDGKHLNIVKL